MFDGSREMQTVLQPGISDKSETQVQNRVRNPYLPRHGQPVPSHTFPMSLSPTIGLLETILPTHRRHPTWVGLALEVNKTLDSAGAGSSKRCKWSRP